jgi:hypothetical protein
LTISARCRSSSSIRIHSAGVHGPPTPPFCGILRFAVRVILRHAGGTAFDHYDHLKEFTRQDEKSGKRPISRNQGGELRSCKNFRATPGRRYPPLAGQGYSTKLYVQVPSGVTKFPAGARFVIRAKLTHPKNGRPYLKSYHNWGYRVLRSSAEGRVRTTELADIDQIRLTVKNKTTRKALIDARLGQGQFPADVAECWGNKCAVTTCGVSEMLRASHIEPWSECTNRERLDAFRPFACSTY